MNVNLGAILFNPIQRAFQARMSEDSKHPKNRKWFLAKEVWEKLNWKGKLKQIKSDLS